MQIHRIRGRSLREALSRAAELCGNDAVVLSQEPDGEGGVTLAVSGQGGELARFGAPQRPSARPGAAPRAGEEAGIAAVRRRLAERGCSGPWIEEIVAEISAREDKGVHPVDAAAAALGARLVVAPAPKTGGGGVRIIALVGPTGVGKTTTLAKLGFRLAAADRRIAFATIDDFRAGASEQLAAFAERLEAPLVTARAGESLATRIAALGDRDVVLLDTTGLSPKDKAGLAELSAGLAAAGRGASLATYLVMAANASRQSLIQAHRAFAALAPAGVVVTKLDEAAEPAVALELCLRARWPVAFLCDGQVVTSHLARPTPDRVADLVLLGRMT